MLLVMADGDVSEVKRMFVTQFTGFEMINLFIREIHYNGICRIMILPKQSLLMLLSSGLILLNAEYMALLMRIKVNNAFYRGLSKDNG